MARRSGKLVRLKGGRHGIVYNDETAINGKLRVHILDAQFKPTDDKVLAAPENLTVFGMVD